EHATPKSPDTRRSTCASNRTAPGHNSGPAFATSTKSYDAVFRFFAKDRGTVRDLVGGVVIRQAGSPCLDEKDHWCRRSSHHEPPRFLITSDAACCANAHD